jgi:hypothetical protein
MGESVVHHEAKVHFLELAVGFGFGSKPRRTALYQLSVH